MVGTIAVFERDLLGQYIDPLDGLWGNVAQFAEARNSLAIEEQDRLARAAAPRAADLRGDGGEQFGDAGRAGGADVAAGELVFGRDIADDRGKLALADDDDIVFGIGLVRGPSIIWRGDRHGLGRGLGEGRDGGGRSEQYQEITVHRRAFANVGLNVHRPAIREAA